MRSSKRYHFYEDRSSGLMERITVTDDHGRDAYVIAREPSRLVRLRRLSLRDLEKNERARLMLKLFGPLTYQLIRGKELQATIAKRRLSTRDRFLVSMADGGEMVATAPLGTAQYQLSRQGRTVAELRARRMGSPPELEVDEGTDAFLIVAVAVVIYLFEYHPGRT